MSNDTSQVPSAPRGKHQCKAKTVSGSRCKCSALAGEDYCYHHLPGNREAIKAAGSKGGSMPRKPVLPTAEALSHKEARRILAGVLVAMLNSKMPESTAKAAAYILQIDSKLRETSEFEARIEALEQARETKGLRVI